MPIISQNFLFKILEYSDYQSYSLESVIEVEELSIEISTNETCYISFDTLGLLWEKAVEISNKPILGYELHRVINIGEFGLVGTLIKYAPTLKDCIQALVDYSILLNDHTFFSLTAFDSQSLFKISYSNGVLETYPVMARQKSFFAIGIFLKTLNELSGKEILIDKIILPQSFYNLLDIEENAKEIVYHNSTDILFYIDNGILEYKNIKSNKKHFDLLQAMGKELMQQSLSLEDRITHYYMTEDLTNVPTIEDVAKHLDKSSRSIQRFLNDKNLSFQDLQINAKMKRAYKYLQQGKTVKETACLVGYAESASFSKAFKKFYSYSPIKIRKKQSLNESNNFSQRI